MAATSLPLQVMWSTDARLWMLAMSWLQAVARYGLSGSTAILWWLMALSWTEITHFKLTALLVCASSAAIQPLEEASARRRLVVPHTTCGRLTILYTIAILQA